MFGRTQYPSCSIFCRTRNPKGFVEIKGRSASCTPGGRRLGLLRADDDAFPLLLLVAALFFILMCLNAYLEPLVEINGETK